jgi:hypothetical protein
MTSIQIERAVPADAAGIIGFQSVDLWSTLLPSMAHVGQLGTLDGRSRSKAIWLATRRLQAAAAARLHDSEIATDRY